VGRAHVPERGDVVQIGRRPALVISPKSYNTKVGLALVCPTTSRLKGRPFEVELPRGLEANGAILCDQLESLDWWARRATRLGSVPDPVMQEVTARILSVGRPGKLRPPAEPDHHRLAAHTLVELTP